MKLVRITLALIMAMTAMQALPYDARQCQGSLGPYTAPDSLVAAPDSLTPVFVNHLGRHGSRYPASSYSATTLRRELSRADSLGTITPLGLQFAAMLDDVISRSNGRWGALDSIGMAEHRGIARRLARQYPELVHNSAAAASATYSPRAIMSMYSFLHELAQCDRTITLATTSGPVNSMVLYPFDIDEHYKAYSRLKPWREAYGHWVDSVAPMTVRRLLGDGYQITDSAARQLSIIEYYNLANMEAMGMPNDYMPYMSLDEYNRLWSCFNLRQYFQHTANAFSEVPAQMFAGLVQDLVAAADDALSATSRNGKRPTLQLRFAHAEVLMPVLSLLQVPGCHLVTTDWNAVRDCWHDFHIVPMAANIQWIYYRAPSGTVYVRMDLNERPTPIIPGRDDIYVPWSEVRRHMLHCIEQ